MSRFSPTVLPEGNFSFADAIAGAGQGFRFGEDVRDRKRQRHREDVSDAEHVADRRATDDARPGAESLDAFLKSPGGASTLRERKTMLPEGQRPAPGAYDRVQFAPDTAGRFYQTATGPVVDRDVARKENVGTYLDRMMPLVDARQQGAAALADKKHIGAMEVVNTTQKHVDARADRGITSREGIAAHGQAGATTRHATPSGDRTTQDLHNELASAQQDLQSLERVVVPDAGAPPDSPGGLATWQQKSRDARDHAIRLHAARDRVARAQADVNAALPHPGARAGGAPADSGAAGPTAAPTGKTPQQWVDEVSADPAWTHRADADIIAEARRRSGQR
jgi:hypothetical protein